MPSRKPLIKKSFNFRFVGIAIIVIGFMLTGILSEKNYIELQGALHRISDLANENSTLLDQIKWQKYWDCTNTKATLNDSAKSDDSFASVDTKRNDVDLSGLWKDHAVISRREANELHCILPTPSPSSLP